MRWDRYIPGGIYVPGISQFNKGWGRSTPLRRGAESYFSRALAVAGGNVLVLPPIGKPAKGILLGNWLHQMTGKMSKSLSLRQAIEQHVPKRLLRRSWPADGADDPVLRPGTRSCGRKKRDLRLIGANIPTFCSTNS